MTTSSNYWCYILFFGITNTSFAYFVALWKKLLDIFSCWIIFGKDHRWNFKTILSCCHLCHKLPFLDGLLMEQTTVCSRSNLLGHILLTFKYYIYISREKHILNYRYSIFQFNEAKEKREPYKTEAQKKRCEKSAKKVNYKYHCTSDLMVHCEKDSGRVERGLFVSLFVYLFCLFLVFTTVCCFILIKMDKWSIKIFRQYQSLFWMKMRKTHFQNFYQLSVLKNQKKDDEDFMDWFIFDPSN